MREKIEHYCLDASRRSLAAIVVCGLAFAFPRSAGAQGTATAPAETAGASRGASQFSLYIPKAGKEREFVEGYAAHIRWHLENRDPWAWYVWQIATGERRGLFVGGSFGHAWNDLDARPKAAEDRADHERTIDVYLQAAHSTYLERRDDFGGGIPLLETTRDLALIELGVRPSARAEFEQAMRELAATRATRRLRYAWFEVVNGSRQPAYLLFVPLDRRSALGAARYEYLGGAASDSSDPAAAAAITRALAAVESVRSELLTFRPDMSSCALASSGCVGTVPAPR
jgi:hypothetical protein